MRTRQAHQKKMHLYRIDFPIRPAVQHPQYYEIAFGRLLIWIFAESPEAAGDRASAILDQLTIYEPVGSKAQVTRIERASPEPELQRCAEQARSSGIAAFLLACEPGADEEDFEQRPI